MDIKEAAEKLYPIEIVKQMFADDIDVNSHDRQRWMSGATWERERDKWVSVNDALPPQREGDRIRTPIVKIKFYLKNDSTIIKEGEAYMHYGSWLSVNGFEPDPLAVVTHWKYKKIKTDI